MSVLTIAQVQAETDRMGGISDAVAAALPTIAASLAANVTYIYGDGTGANPSLGDPAAVNALGPAAVACQKQASGIGVASLFLSAQVAALSNYFQTQAAAGNLATGVRDVASFVRSANGCTDPSPAGSGSGSTYAYLLHPSYASLIASLTGGVSPLPPDAVFAPTGFVLGTYDMGTTHFTAGQATLTAGTGPYAPVKLFAAATPAGDGTTPPVPNGSLHLVVTGLNQAGVSVTWRGDCGTGFTGANQHLASGLLLGTSGGSGGGTAAPTDRIKQVTNIALDGAVSSTATHGTVEIIALQERATL